MCIFPLTYIYFYVHLKFQPMSFFFFLINLKKNHSQKPQVITMNSFIVCILESISPPILKEISIGYRILGCGIFLTLQFIQFSLLSFCLNVFRGEVQCYFYLCSSTGKVHFQISASFHLSLSLRCHFCGLDVIGHGVDFYSSCLFYELPIFLV